VLTPAPTGYYSIPTSVVATRRTGQALCDSSSYCSGGLQYSFLSLTSCPSSLSVSENVKGVNLTGSLISARQVPVTQPTPGWFWLQLYTCAICLMDNRSAVPGTQLTMALLSPPWDFSKRIVGHYSFDGTLADQG
jgi:hypothetical protein